MSRLAGDALDDDRTRLDLGDFLFKEALDEPGRGAGDEHLRVPAAALDALDVHFDLVADVVLFARDLILREHEPLDLPLAEFDVHVPRVHFAHEPAHEFALLVGELGERVVAFRLVDLLQNDLLCGLRRDARKVLGRKFVAEDVAHLGALFEFLRLFEGDLPFAGLLRVGHGARKIAADGTLFGIELDLHPSRLAVELLFIGGDERRFERFDKGILADPLFAFQIGKRRKEIFIDHDPFLPVDKLTAERRYTSMSRQTLEVLSKGMRRSPFSVCRTMTPSSRETSVPS